MQQTPMGMHHGTQQHACTRSSMPQGRPPAADQPACGSGTHRMRGTSQAATSSALSAMMLIFLAAIHRVDGSSRWLLQAMHKDTCRRSTRCHAPMLGVSQCMPTPEGIARSHTSTQPLPTFARCVGIAEQQLGCHHAWRHNMHAHPAAGGAAAALCCRHLGSERILQLRQRSLGGTVGGIARCGVAPAARMGGGR